MTINTRELGVIQQDLGINTTEQRMHGALVDIATQTDENQAALTEVETSEQIVQRISDEANRIDGLVYTRTEIDASAAAALTAATDAADASANSVRTDLTAALPSLTGVLRFMDIGADGRPVNTAAGVDLVERTTIAGLSDADFLYVGTAGGHINGVVPTFISSILREAGVENGPVYEITAGSDTIVVSAAGRGDSTGLFIFRMEIAQ